MDNENEANRVVDWTGNLHVPCRSRDVFFISDVVDKFINQATWKLVGFCELVDINMELTKFNEECSHGSLQALASNML